MAKLLVLEPTVWYSQLIGISKYRNLRTLALLFHFYLAADEKAEATEFLNCQMPQTKFVSKLTSEPLLF